MGRESADTILIFAANPSDQPRLSLDREVREIENGLRNSRKHFAVKQQWATRPKDLRRALLDYKPAYVHFCGHGAGRDGIVLEGNLVDAEALAGLFGLFSSTIRCVVLNACYSTIQAVAIARHIDFVIGMNQEIGDSAAIEFASAFYDALGAGESVEFSFALGCNAIQLAGIPEHLTPQLLTRSNPVSLERPASPRLPSRSQRYDWDGAPAVDVLFGREAAAEILKAWILDDLCRVVLITGMGGIGKTDLATCLGRGGNRSSGTSETLASGIHGQFDCVMWRSLLNAPAPDQFFAEALNFLSEQRPTARYSSNTQVENILTHLQARRCLLIIDNVEAVLQPGDPTMQYRDGYEAYGSFFETVAKTPHQSCLLLTSREKPRPITDLEGARKPVRSLSLGGIGVADTRNLLTQIGDFAASEEHVRDLVKLYDGNPLALELVARHIDQVFGSDLAAFLGSGRPVFADLENLLNWHFDRLTKKETELLYWLAIERGPVTLPTLYDDLASPGSREDLASTLQTLQRRIPLERITSRHFGLQPVLIEHATSTLVDRIVSGLSEAIAQLKTGAIEAAALDALELLRTHSLVKATAKENIRDSQERLILGRIAERLPVHDLGGLRASFELLLDVWRRERPQDLGYAAGNIINLLSYLKVSLHGLDCSQLPIWQACLHGVSLHDADFSFAAFRHPTLRHPFGTIFAVCYSPDGKVLAFGDDNGDIRTLLTGSGQLHLHFLGHSDVVSAVTFNPDGHVLASASFDNTIRVWNMKDGRCTNVLLGHKGWVYSLAFSPDGKVLASASEDGTCRLWDLSTGLWASPETSEPGFMAAVAFSPDGEMVAVAGSAGVVSLFHCSDLARPMVLKRHCARIRALAFSPQGDMLASGAEDKEIDLWRPADGEHLATLHGHSGRVTSLSFSAIGDLLASASDDHTVRLWSTARSDCVGQLEVAPARVWAVQCSPLDRTLATGSEDGAVRIWDMDTHECLRTFRGYSNKTWSLASSPDPSLILAGNEDGLARVWNIREAQTSVVFRGHSSRIWSVASSLDGKWGASASDDLTVRLWEIRTGTCVRILRGHTDWIRSVAFAPDSRLLASGGEDGTIVVRNTANGAAITSIDALMSRVFSVAFCNGGSYLAAAGTAHQIHLFHPEKGNKLGELAGHEGWLSALVPLGSTLASCSEDGTLRLWDLKRLTCISTFHVGSRLWCGASCHQGRSLLTGSEDGVLRCWSIGSGLCEAEIQTHQGSLLSLAVNATETTVATAGDDGSIRLWKLPGLLPVASPNSLRPARPYEGLNISGATGLSLTQRESLMALGALSIPGP